MLRLLVSPKWITWHVLTLGAMVACGFLSAWQWHRAGSAMGSALNVGYGVQWPIFAVFFGFMWWRFLRMELRTLREHRSGEEPAGDSSRAAPENGSPGGRRSPVAAPSAAASAASAASAAEQSDRGSPGEALSSGSADVTVPSARASGEPDERPSPFTPRPAGVGPSRLSDPQIRAYNEALADLAARDRET